MRMYARIPSTYISYTYDMRIPGATIAYIRTSVGPLFSVGSSRRNDPVATRQRKKRLIPKEVIDFMPYTLLLLHVQGVIAVAND